MTINVKYLSLQQIERDALGLLEAYFHDLGQPIQIPIPVDEILENHLGLSLDFDDLQSVLGVPDVLGALWADTREVFIDQSLEPEQHPEQEGRYNFSVSHEIGHWRLHRQYLRNRDKQIAAFTDRQPGPTVICRTSQAKERIEQQANSFAACLLMPRSMVIDAWIKAFRKPTPFVFAAFQGDIRFRRPRYQGLRPIGAVARGCVHDEPEHQYAFELYAKELAPKFRVSVQAMRIRLEKLGLLLVDFPPNRDLFQSRQV